jgi:hypothetical protein
MIAGAHDPGEIIASVKNGIYAVNFGGGQVDITSGKYVFNVTEAYRIEDGKIGAPLKGAMLIGNGPTDLTASADRQSGSIPRGTCGKDAGRFGVGQPALRMDKITVGGTGNPLAHHPEMQHGRHRRVIDLRVAIGAAAGPAGITPADRSRPGNAQVRCGCWRAGVTAPA